jgi:hypothetical protein
MVLKSEALLLLTGLDFGLKFVQALFGAPIGLIPIWLGVNAGWEFLKILVEEEDSTI